MRIGSLFSGIGGLELGLEWAGVGRTSWQVELDEGCRAVLAEHWPHADRFSDVRAVGRHNLRHVDLICGGFPCQDTSLAGKGAGLGGARSGLWYEFKRIVGELRPRFVVVENGANSARRWLSPVRADLRGLGYHTRALRIAAADVGAGHLRARIFVVAYLDRRGRGAGGLAGVGGAMGSGRDDSDGAAAATNASAEVRPDAPRRRRLQGAGGVGEAGGRAIPDDGGARARAVNDGDSAGLSQREGVGGDAREAERATLERDGGEGRSVGDREPERGLVRGVHGLPAWLDRRFPAPLDGPQFAWEPPRLVKRQKGDAQRVAALGNAVVPAVAYVVGRVVMQIAGGILPA